MTISNNKNVEKRSSKVSFPLAVTAIAFAFLALVGLNNLLFNKARLDLTEGQIYSISDGSYQVLAQIDEPINLYFFFSNKTTEGLTSLRNYASRVQSLLEEYERFADGKINLQIIDPEPFSEAEDKAAEMGLTAAPLSALGDNVYLGLAGTNALDDKEIIAFFDPSQEQLLEYEISKLIHRLSNSSPNKVAMLSSLAIAGGTNPNPMAMQMGQPQQTPEWATYAQLQQLYEVEALQPEAESIPEDSNILLLVHPQNLTEGQLFAIEQFVLKGGKLLVFVDPNAESDNSGAMMGMPGGSSSNLEKLFAAWGVYYDPQQVVLDAAKGLEIRLPNGLPGRHIGYLGLDRNDIDSEDVVTTSLASINGASFGALAPAEDATTEFSALISSSEFAALVDVNEYKMSGQNPELLTRNFSPTNINYALAARISGPVKSAFSEVPEGQDASSFVEQSDNVQVIVVADTDVLTDAFWVQTANFFGQTILQPFANNGDFLINAIDNLSGSSALLSVRGRGKYQRPFEVVEALTVEAEARFREQEQRLQQELEQTEAQLAQLQSAQSDNGALVLTPEQEAAIEEFMAQKLTIRKELREVRHQLDKDIESLGSWLKVLNIAVFPLLLTLLLALVARMWRKSLSNKYRVEDVNHAK